MPDMTAEILITRPEHDEPTSYLASWCNPVIKFAEERDKAQQRLLGDETATI